MSPETQPEQAATAPASAVSPAELSRRLSEAPTLATARWVLDRVEASGASPLTTLRVAFERSFTIEPVGPLLQAMALQYGARIELYFGPFNAYSQELLQPGSELDRFAPDVTILAIQSRDILPEIWSPAGRLDPESAQAAVGRALTDIEGCIRAFRSRSRSALLLHNLEQPDEASAGVLDAQSTRGQRTAIESFNRGLVALAQQDPAAYVLDYDSLVARWGRREWHDWRKWHTMRMPIAAASLPRLASEYVRYLLPLAGRSCKAVAVDLDNTLWGGVLGEEGVNRIQIGPEHPGAAYLDLQRALMELHDRGILLTICSKNSEPEALSALETRPEMLLRPGHFAAKAINWNDKAANLQQLAQELNIGLDSMVFLDDNPAERERVRQALAEVTVLELPDDPYLYASTVRDCPLFQRLRLSKEDLNRTELYQQQHARQSLQQAAGSIDEYLLGLEMAARIEPLGEDNLERIAQLTQKTNQFNLTTRRYAPAQLQQMAGRSEWRVAGMRLADRFGDNGLIGVLILRMCGMACEIDTLLLSCRVIGRRAETAMLAAAAEMASKAGARLLEGRFIPTERNAPASDFYPSHGFVLEREDADGQLWRLDLKEHPVVWPDCIRRHNGC